MTMKIEITDVGGIDQQTHEFTPGVTLIAGPNASNKTSTMKAIAFAMGCDDIPIKSGADEAHVRLVLDDQTVERTAKRKGGGTQITGEALLQGDDAEKFRTAASLLEFNPLRVAVRQNEGIEELLKSPANINALENRQDQLLSRKREIRTELDELEGTEDELETRRSELTSKREQAEDLREELRALREEQSATEPVSDTAGDLREKRASTLAERDQQEEQIESLESAVERIKDQRAELDEEITTVEAELESKDVETLEEERIDLQEAVDEIDERLDVLQAVLTANREMLASDLSGVLGSEHSLMEDTVTCWTCGQDASISAIDETLGRLSELIDEEKQRKRKHTPEIESLTEQIESAEELERKLSELQAERSTVEQRLEQRQESLETRREQLSTLESELADLDEQIVEEEREQSAAVSELTEQIEQKRVELSTVEREIDRLEGRCQTLESQVEMVTELEAEIRSVTAEIQEVTERLENLESELRNSFNESMDELLAVLDFDRLERVWLDGSFDIVVAREVDGRIHRDSVQHLSESEREMIGLVLGLAAYETYDIDEIIPVLQIDSLGAFDNNHIQSLIEYLNERTTYLMAAVHPDVAATVDFDQLQRGEVTEAT